MKLTFLPPTKFTIILSGAWWFAYVPFAALEGRLFWEETWLTWTRGPQMIGFSLAHLYPELLFVGLLGGVGTLLWSVVVLGTLLTRRHRLQRFGAVQLALSGVTMLLVFLPIDRWVLRLR